MERYDSETGVRIRTIKTTCGTVEFRGTVPGCAFWPERLVRNAVGAPVRIPKKMKKAEK